MLAEFEKINNSQKRRGRQRGGRNSPRGWLTPSLLSLDCFQIALSCTRPHQREPSSWGGSSFKGREHGDD